MKAKCTKDWNTATEGNIYEIIKKYEDEAENDYTMFVVVWVSEKSRQLFETGCEFYDHFEFVEE